MNSIDPKQETGVSGGYRPEDPCIPPFPIPIDYPPSPLGPFPEPLPAPDPSAPPYPLA